MSRQESRPTSKARLGCGYLLFAVVITCVLLTINALLVTNAYMAISISMPEGTIPPRVSQALVFLGPIVLLVLEWWAFDVSTDWLNPRRRGENG